MTTFINAVLTSTSRARVEKVGNGRVTKAALGTLLKDPDPIAFISTSIFHDHGRHFTGADAVAKYGPVTVELRTPTNQVVMIAFHPGKPARIS